MTDYPISSQKDEEIQLLIDWLSTKDNVGKQVIDLTITVIQGLMSDRRLLVQALEGIKHV